VLTRTNCLFAAMILFVFLGYRPPSVDAEDGGLIQGLSPMMGQNDLGIVFNTNDLLFGLQSYQAGIGGKIGWGNLYLRGLLDITLNGSSQSFAADIGATGEYHFFSGPISPYVGALAGVGYETQASVASATSFSLGVVAGVEVFLFDFLSLFAEYAIEGDFTVATDLQTSQTTFDYLINTRMGNNAKIGVVIYFMRSRTKPK
jgi:hypothetical protein